MSDPAKPCLLVVDDEPELTECLTKLGDLDGEVRMLHDRIGRLELEYQRICKLVESGGPKML